MSIADRSSLLNRVTLMLLLKKAGNAIKTVELSKVIDAMNTLALNVFMIIVVVTKSFVMRAYVFLTLLF